MRKVLVLGGAVCAVIIALAVLLLSLDVNQFRPQIETELRAKLKRPVSLGQVGWKLLPLSLRIEGLRIDDAPGFATKAPFVTAKEVYVRVSLLKLLRRTVEIEALTLQQPAVELVRDSRGVWNYSDLGGKSAGGGTPGIGSFTITDGRLSLTDLQAGTGRSTYDHIDLSVNGFAPGQKFEIKGAVHLPGEGRQTVRIEGTGGPPGANSSGPSDFAGNLMVEDVSLGELLKAAGGGGGGLDAIVAGEGKVELRGGVLTSQGKIDAKQVKLGETPWKEPIVIQYRLEDDIEKKDIRVPSVVLTSGQAELNAALRSVRGSLSGSGAVKNLRVPFGRDGGPLTIAKAAFRMQPDTVALSDIQCSLGSSRLNGQATVRGFSSPDLQFTADVDQVDVAEMQKLTATSDKGQPRSARPSKVTAKGSVTVGRIRYNTLVLSKVKAAVSFDRGILQLSPIEAESSGGRLSGAMNMDIRADHPKVHVAAKLARVQADQLLSALSSTKPFLFGLLSAESDTGFILRPGEDVARSLNGTVKMQLVEGRILGANLINEMASLGKLLGAVKRADPFTGVSQMAGTLRIADGLVTTDDVKVEMDGGTVAAAGKVNLVDQAIDLKLTTVFNRQFTERAGGNKAGGWMTTVLGNNQGEMVIPALVTGTLQQLRFAPDPQRFAQMKLKGLLPSTGKPGAAGAIQGVFDALKGTKSGEGAKPGGTPEKRPVDSVLDLFRKRKKEEPPQK